MNLLRLTLHFFYATALIIEVFRGSHMHCKKSLFIILYALWLISHASAAELLVHKTEYFDIIYAKESEKSAALLAEYADRYAEEIASRLNKKIWVRMPVYILAGAESLNGYFTFFPYPRIVVFDTVPEDGTLGNFTDSMLKVFYHELTHAISLIYYLPVLPLSFNEGAAVSYESLDGRQGRLHDPLFYHHLMQGKIDGCAPSWQQAAGHRDVYPGAFWGYLYGAGFADYLQKKYGMESYARYWHSSFFIFPQGKTKHIFGKPLKSLWNEFLASIQAPATIRLPVPFPETGKSGFMLTAANGQGFACFDFTQGEVRFYTPDGISEKLFTANRTLSHLSFSPDGLLLLITDTVQSLESEKHRSTVFDMRTKRFLPTEYYSLRMAAFCDNDRICGVKTDGQFSHLVIADMPTTAMHNIDRHNTETQETLFSAGPGMPYTAIYDPVYAGEHTIAFIAANGIDRDILFINTETKKIQKLLFEEPLPAIRCLQTNTTREGTMLTFSWAKKGMLYRAATYTLKTNMLKVLKEDISGGVFYPAVLSQDRTQRGDTELLSDELSVGTSEGIPTGTPAANTAGNKKIDTVLVYTGVHAKYNTLCTVSEELFTAVQATLTDYMSYIPDLADAREIPEAPEIRSISPKPELLNPKKYRYLSWMWRVFPLLYVTPPDNLQKANETGLALDIYGIDPTTLLSFKTASIFYFKPFFYQIHANLTVNTKPVGFSIKVYDLNNHFRYRTVGGSVDASFPIPTKNGYRHIALNAGISAESFSFFPKDYARQKTLYWYKLRDTVLSEQISFRYAYLKPIVALNTPFFAKSTAGIEVLTGIKHGYHFESHSNAGVLQALMAFHTPVLPLTVQWSGYAGYNAYYIPELGGYTFFNNPAFMGLSAYLPSMPEHLQVGTTIRTSDSTINVGFAFDAELTLLSYDIQTGSSWLPIFYNRLNISIGYKNMLNSLGNSSALLAPYFYQSVYGRTAITISGSVKIGLEYAHPIKKDARGKLKLLVSADF